MPSLDLSTQFTLWTLRALRFAYFGIFAVLLWKLMLTRMYGARVPRRRIRLILLLVMLAFLGVYAYQATWQLGGFTRGKFIAFMEQYNPRPDNAAGRITRGRILDANGKVLAESDPGSAGFRRYPYGPSMAHIVGYRHPARGLTGVEKAVDADVSGYVIDSKKAWERVGNNALKLDRNVGMDVQINIDADLQQFAYEQLAGRRGAVVGINPQNGEIKILATSPSFDPNDFQARLNNDPEHPLINRAIHGRYPPGSTFKLAVAALAAESRVSSVLPCPAEGYYYAKGVRPIRDHEYYDYEAKGLKWGGFGSLDLGMALAKSSNTYFARAGVESGPDNFNALASRLWINARIPIYEGLSGTVYAQRGNVPKLGHRDTRELAQLSIGQGRLLVTPLHMAMLTSAVAADGHLWRPRLNAAEKPSELNMPFSEQSAKKVKRAMRMAVEKGTARKADIPGLDVCGKTGTAQNPLGESHAWFVCFAPMERPTLALAVIVENAGYGSRAAIPVAAEILKRHFAQD